MLVADQPPSRYLPPLRYLLTCLLIDTTVWLTDALLEYLLSQTLPEPTSKRQSVLPEQIEQPRPCRAQVVRIRIAQRVNEIRRAPFEPGKEADLIKNNNAMERAAG